MSAVAARLAELGIVLPAFTPPKFTYVSTVQTGNLLFVSGHTSTRGASPVTGKLGTERTVDEGYRAARMVAIEILATIEDALGSLDRVTRVVKLLGMVNSPPDFTQAPAVINGASDLFVEVFGERGRHARSAFGVASLPADASVEIEAIVEVATPG